MKFYLFLVVVLNFLQAFGQKTISIIPTHNSERIVLDESYFKEENSSSVQFTEFKLYIAVLSKKNQKAKEYHLIDLKNPETLKIILDENDNSNTTIIQFGIDSVTSVSGAMDDDLDPINNMYWTWQSGYINLKLEGTISTSTEKNQLFQYHIGGYSHPFNTSRLIEAHLKTNELFIPLDFIFDNKNSQRPSTIMSPNNDAQNFMTDFINTIISAN